MPMLTDPQLAPKGVLFAVDGGGHELDDAYAPSVGGGWRWLHLAQTSSDVRRWVVEESGIPIAEAKALVADHARPRCVQTEQGLMFIGRGVNLDPTSVPEDMKSIRVWLEPSRIITVVKRRMRSAEAIALRFSTDHPPKSASEVLVQLFSQMTELLAPVVQELGEQIDEIRDSVIDDDLPTADISTLSPLRLRAMGLHRYLTPLYDAALTLSSSKQLTESKAARAEVQVTRDQLARIHASSGTTGAGGRLPAAERAHGHAGHECGWNPLGRQHLGLSDHDIEHAHPLGGHTRCASHDKMDLTHND